MDQIDRLKFLSEEQVRQIGKKHTPVFVYSRSKFAEQAEKALNFEAPYGLTVRYAMKANPHIEILQLFNSMGVFIDASSKYEAEIAMKAGVLPSKIQITTQEIPDNLAELLKQGVKFNACSLHQLEEYGKIAPGTCLGVRVNPGTGTGLNNRLTTAGLVASFGIWYEYISDIHKLAKKYGLTIDLVHTHGGTDTHTDWLKIVQRNLEIVEQFPTAASASIGGGFKVGLRRGEHTVDIQETSAPIAQELENFYKKTGRKIKFEIEPGRFLVADGGTLITKIIDTKDTGKEGHKFLVVNGGMTEVLRPAIYGAQHPLVVVKADPAEASKTVEEYAVSGHCCESGDVLTVAPGDPDTLQPRLMAKAQIDDYLCVEVVGAYCASFNVSGYNSFPVAKEVFVD